MMLKFKQRWEQIKGIVLDRGGHHDEAYRMGPDNAVASGTACVMEAVAWVAGEEWSDRPACVDPYLSMMARAMNDSGSQAMRDQLRDRIPEFLGTNKGEVMMEKRRQRARKLLHVKEVHQGDYSVLLALSSLVKNDPESAMAILDDLLRMGKKKSKKKKPSVCDEGWKDVTP